jgi:hypothetical protein
VGSGIWSGRKRTAALTRLIDRAEFDPFWKLHAVTGNDADDESNCPDAYLLRRYRKLQRGSGGFAADDA